MSKNSEKKTKKLETSGKVASSYQTEKNHKSAKSTEPALPKQAKKK